VPQTVARLAEEVADRYYQLFNLRPDLVLSLPDGAKLAPNDLISSLFLNDEEVGEIVTVWC